MADRFFSGNLGVQVPSQVTEGGATSGQQVELRINDTAYTKPLQVQLVLEAIRNYLRTKETNPIA